MVGKVGVVATGRHFAAEAGMRMLARGGNAVDAGVAATFAAAVSEISHFGLGGEVPIILYLADRREVVVINGQGTAPAARHPRPLPDERIPANGPSAGTVPAVVDALAIALAEFGTRSLAEVLAPAIELADGFAWYEFLTGVPQARARQDGALPERGARVSAGPGPARFRRSEASSSAGLGRTLRALVEAEQRHLAQGRKAAIYAARDRFYRGDIGQRIAAAVQDAGGLMTAADLAGYRGRVERAHRLTQDRATARTTSTRRASGDRGRCCSRRSCLLEGFDLERMGHNSTEYIHTVTEALKLALADRDDLRRSRLRGARGGLLSPAYAAERRKLIDPRRAHKRPRPGDPWKFEPGAEAAAGRSRDRRRR